jgi:hypothetical protein
MTTRIIAILLMAAAPTVAQAETFTFKGKVTPTTRVMVMPATPDGRPLGGQAVNVREEIDANGKKTTTNGECVEWFLPPGDPLLLRAVCRYSDASGELFISQFACDAPGPAAACSGRMTGTGGAYKGRTGAVAFRIGPDGPSGVGFWTDPPPAK